MSIFTKYIPKSWKERWSREDLKAGGFTQPQIDHSKFFDDRQMAVIMDDIAKNFGSSLEDMVIRSPRSQGKNFVRNEKLKADVFQNFHELEKKVSQLSVNIAESMAKTEKAMLDGYLYFVTDGDLSGVEVRVIDGSLKYGFGFNGEIGSNALYSVKRRVIGQDDHLALFSVHWKSEMGKETSHGFHAYKMEQIPFVKIIDPKTLERSFMSFEDLKKKISDKLLK